MSAFKWFLRSFMRDVMRISFFFFTHLKVVFLVRVRSKCNECTGQSVFPSQLAFSWVILGHLRTIHFRILLSVSCVMIYITLIQPPAPLALSNKKWKKVIFRSGGPSLSGSDGGQSKERGVRGKRMLSYRLQLSPKFTLSLHYWPCFHLFLQVG